MITDNEFIQEESDMFKQLSNEYGDLFGFGSSNFMAELMRISNIYGNYISFSEDARMTWEAVEFVANEFDDEQKKATLDILERLATSDEYLDKKEMSIIYAVVTVCYDELDKINTVQNESLTQRFINKARGIAKGVKVGGISNAMIYFPKCCSPIPGDNILGYITKGRGVTIHRVGCSNIPLTKSQDRFIEVEWDFAKNSSFLVRMKIEIEDRKHLLKDLTESTSSMSINIKSVDISAEDGIATCLLIIEIIDIKQLNRLKNRIIKNVNPISIERV